MSSVITKKKVPLTLFLFCCINFIISLVNLVIHAGVGTLWWKVLGLW